MDKSNMW